MKFVLECGYPDCCSRTFFVTLQAFVASHHDPSIGPSSERNAHRTNLLAIETVDAFLMVDLRSHEVDDTQTADCGAERTDTVAPSSAITQRQDVQNKNQHKQSYIDSYDPPHHVTDHGSIDDSGRRKQVR